jgi:hypothetical protein
MSAQYHTSTRNGYFRISRLNHLFSNTVVSGLEMVVWNRHIRISRALTDLSTPDGLGEGESLTEAGSSMVAVVSSSFLNGTPQLGASKATAF